LLLYREPEETPTPSLHQSPRSFTDQAETKDQTFPSSDDDRRLSVSSNATDQINDDDLFPSGPSSVSKPIETDNTDTSSYSNSAGA